MLDKIYNILVSILGESKQGYYDPSVAQYQFNCINCAEENGGAPDNKYNLEVNLSMCKAHCWKCGEMGNLSYIIKKYGGKELLHQYLAAIKDLKEGNYLDPDLFNDTGITETIDGEILKLPSTFRKINLSFCKNKMLIDYLNKRKISQDIIDRYQIGYTNSKEEMPSLRNRIIIPSYNDIGELNYWVGRDFTGNDKRMKYWNSKLDKNHIIFQESLIQWDATIWLCEGAIDCLYGNGNFISLLGKSLKNNCELYSKILEKANADIVICLDGDTDINETKRIYKLLNKGRLRGKIWYIRLGTEDLPYKDFGEAYEAGQKNELIKVLKNKKQFGEIDLLI